MSKEQEFSIFGEFESIDSNPLDQSSDEGKLPDGVIVVDENEDDKTPGLDESKDSNKTKETDKVDSEDDETDEEEVEDTSKDTEKDSKKKTKVEKKEEEIAEEDEEEDNSSESDQKYSFKALASYLAEQGAIDFEDSEDLDDSPELIEEAVRNTAVNMVNEYKESLPDVVSDLVTFIEKGGDPYKYLQALEKPVDLTSIDLSKEDNQKKVISEHLKETDHTQEEIDEILQDYEDAMMLEKQSKLASKKLEKIYEKKKQDLIQAQENANKEREETFKKHIDSIKSTINNSTTLAGIDISANDKKELEKYLLTVGKDGLTQWQKDLKEDGIQAQLELAYLKMKKFDFSKLTKKVKTDITKQFKGIFNNTEKTVKGKSKQYQDSDNSKAGDLSAFNSIFV